MAQRRGPGSNQLWLIAMLLAVAVFGAHFLAIHERIRGLSGNIVIAAREHGSDDLAGVLQHLLQDDLVLFATTAPPPEQLQTFHRRIRMLLSGSSIVKLALHDPADGTVRYSSDLSEIGTVNADVVRVADPSLRTGRSRLVRDQLVANFEGITLRSGVIVTEAPVYRNDPRSGISTGEVLLIAEIYSDASPILLRETTLRGNFALALGLLTAVMLSLSFTVIWLFQIRQTSDRIRAIEADATDA